MVAGLVFLALRRLLALVPPLALRLPVKKIAAVTAFGAISFYALFAAPNVPTQRAWMMTSIVLAAIVLDRTALTMRLVAWAAMAVLVLSPEAMLGPSFQMSFAAVVALIAAWETTRRIGAGPAERGPLARAGRALAGAALTSLVAGAASGAFALYHFNRFAAYGLVANMLAVPVTGLWVMPWGILAAVLWPFGLEAWALRAMIAGVEVIIAIATSVASWPGAVALAPSMPIWGGGDQSRRSVALPLAGPLAPRGPRRDRLGLGVARRRTQARHPDRRGRSRDGGAWRRWRLAHRRESHRDGAGFVAVARGLGRGAGVARGG
jgi:competence protein ComEC